MMTAFNEMLRKAEVNEAGAGQYYEIESLGLKVDSQYGVGKLVFKPLLQQR